MSENHTKVQQAFRVLHPLLAGYICQEMRREYQDNWWQEVLMTLSDQVRDLPDDNGDYAALMDSLDMANCLRLFDRKWNDLFKRKLSIDYRTWAKELMGVRNKLAHIGGTDFSEDDTWRALDTMARLCEAFDDEAAEEIRKILRQLRYGSAEGSTNVVEVAAPTKPKAAHTGIMSKTLSGLPSWRDVMEPHPDVAQGRYKNAEFAADLAQVARGEGAFEYRDPVEFFARTYVTEGMTGLLVQALKRVSGKDGEPVIQLKTAFGGGKTHSMLALYHMMRGKVSADRIPNIKPVLAQAGVSALPKANVAVLVGTALDPTRTKRPINFPGITINTLWGEMAAQLAESAGRPELYDFVKEADKKGVSPGSEALKNLFDACGPCLVLMDELWHTQSASTVLKVCPPVLSTTSSPLFRRLPKPPAPARTALWWLLSRNPTSKSAAKRERPHWRPSSIPLGGWNPSGSPLPPTRALKLCAAVCSLTARTQKPATGSVLSSASCTRPTPAIFRRRSKRWNTATG